ncbi:MAG: DUF2200 domain-containing protein [Parafannyhessea sp.]|uniref:DUF2200 domain-containing protein n=1 Tax=Parafannyhessea sp. TaxID=2847324 RepID=UPI003F08740C
MAGSDRVFGMRFGKVWQCLVNKAVRKGRSADEVFAVAEWMTGYTRDGLEALAAGDATYGDFLRDAPHMNPDRLKVTGSVCGIRVQDIEDPMTRDMRILDKLVDELAHGKPMEKILRS